MKKKELSFSFILFLFLAVLLFWQFFIKGLYLFPGNYLIAWFEPYKSDTFKNGNILVAHKPVADDVFRHIYPFKTLAIDEIKQWELPLWNPYNGAGMPLLATVNSGLIDPFNLLFFIMPYILAWNMYLFLQFVLIGFCTYIYCRKINLSVSSSFFSAIAFVLSGAVVARVSLGAYGLGIAMLPFILFIIESYFINPKTKLVFLLPFALFACITSTHPQITFYILVFSLIYLLVRTISAKKNTRFFLWAFLFFAFGVLLSAVQILPTAELLSHSNFSTETSSYVSNFLVSYYHLIAIGIPNYFGNAATYNFWGKSDYIETVVAIGLIPCFFAYIALFFNKKLSTNFPGRKIFLWGTLISIILAVSSPLSKFILSLPIPILSTDPPSRIFILTTFFLCILSGQGFEIFLKNTFTLTKKIKFSLPFLIAVTLLIIGTGYLVFAKYTCGQGFIEKCYQIALRNTLLETFIFTLGFVLFLLASINTQAKKLCAYLIIFIIFGIGFYNAQKYLPFSPKNTVLPNSSLFQELNKLSKDGRAFGFGDATITTDLATYFRFFDPQYYHPLYIKRYGELTAFANYGNANTNVLRSDAMIRNDISISEKDELRRQRLLSLLNVRYFVFNKSEKPLTPSEKIIWSDNNRYIIQNPKALPRVFAVTDLITQKDNKILETLFSKNFLPSKQVILEENPDLLSKNMQLKSLIRVNKYQSNEVEIDSTTNTKSVLVLLDNYYPGWNAFIDGKQTKVYRADYSFRAIILPAGKHKVKFVYDPMSARIGGVISLASLFIILLFLLRSTKLRPH